MAQPESYAVEWDLAQLLDDCRRCRGLGLVPELLSKKPQRCKRCHGRGRGLRGLARQHEAELKQRERLLGVSATLIALCALCLGFHGLPGVAAQQRRRLWGRGLQLPLRFLSILLGRHPSTICDALNQGMELGLLERHAFVRRVELVTHGRLSTADVKRGKGQGGGREQRERINVHGVLYLTRSGAELLRDMGRIRAEGVEKSGGVVGRLLTTLAPIFRAVAVRCASARKGPTPEGGDNYPNNNYSSSPALLVTEGGALGTEAHGSDPPGARRGLPARVVDLPPRALCALGLLSPKGRGWPRTLDALTRFELLQVLQVFTSPEALWPWLWKHGDVKARQWLASEYERLRARALGRPWHASGKQQAGR